MGVRLLVFGLALAVLGGAGYGVYSLLRPGEGPPLSNVEYTPSDEPLPPADEFEHLAKTDPVAMLARCLDRYQREVKGGFTATLEKAELVLGKPHPTGIIRIAARDEFADHPGLRPQVRMVWTSGFPKDPILGFEIHATLLSEKPDGAYEIVTWRPSAVRKQMAVAVNGAEARGQSRYCMRDAGIYRGTLRTYEVWKARQAAGQLKTEYLGKRPEEKVGGRVCHVVRRTCPRPEVDAFEVGGQPSADPKEIDRDGFTEVTIMIDAERWLQVGIVIKRTDVTPERLIGEYYFRDVELNPTFRADTFTVEAMKAAAK
ncbi:MAG TPA: hypothetical protein VKE74_32735 [Gemmataceae bacterium]|nr:hypothetical protein [Gemmataceae bacterium]